MRNVLSHIFYLSTAVFIMYEIIKLVGGFNPYNFSTFLKEKSAEYKEKSQVENRTEKEVFEDSVQMLWYTFSGLAFVIFSTIYILWSLVGLASSQWVFFLLILLLSLVSAFCVKVLKVPNDIVIRADSFLTVVILVLIMLNKYHLGWVF